MSGNSIKGLWAQVRYPLGFGRQAWKQDDMVVQVFGCGTSANPEVSTIDGCKFFNLNLRSTTTGSTAVNGIYLKMTKAGSAACAALKIEVAGGATALDISGSIALSGVSTALLLGTQANLSGSGTKLSSTVLGALRVFSDDGGANVGDSVRGAQSRTLLTISQSGGTIRALQGQLKVLTGVNFDTGVYTANQGYVELAATNTVSSGGTLSCFDASVEIGTALTVAGKMFGVRAETTGSGTVTLSGSGHSAGFGVTKASGAAKWPTGIYIEGGAVVEAIQIGVKSSSNGNGIVLNDTAVDGSGITRAVGVFSEIGASLPTAGIDTVAVESRLLVALDMSSRTGNSIKASRGHLRIAGGKLAAAAESCGLSGYIEISGTSAIGVGGINAAISATVEASGTVTGAANDILAGVCVSGTNLTLGTARSTAFQVYAGSLFTSLLDVGGGCSFVVGSDGSGAYQYLYVYINNTRHRIACRAD